jgi:hypothetical protein
MMKYIALSAVSCLLIQATALADEVKSSTTEIKDAQGYSNSKITTESDPSCSKVRCIKTMEPAASPALSKKTTESYSNDGAVEQKEVQTETKVNP